MLLLIREDLYGKFANWKRSKSKYRVVVNSINEFDSHDTRFSKWWYHRGCKFRNAK